MNVYIKRVENRNIPSSHVKVKSQKNISNNIPVHISREPSLKTIERVVFIELNTATNPRIIPRLKIFEPTTLPTDIAASPDKAAETVTANSGADVANATTVNPITNSDKPNFFAILDAETTILTAPPHKPRMHKTIIPICNTTVKFYYARIVLIECENWVII